MTVTPAKPCVPYIVVSPTRNERDYLPLTIASMCAQSCRPRQWLLVDDGSSDGTAEIVDSAAREHPWIVAIHRRDRGFRQAGTGVVEAFYAGYQAITAPWRYIVKLDGDLSFAPDYFERCIEKLESNRQLGIVGGTCSVFKGEDLVTEFPGEPQFHVRGPTKIYRRECFEAIGGLVKAPGWDTIDQMKANMLGWKTSTLEDVPIVHHRSTGHAYGSWSNFTKNGLANYISGYLPFFMLLKCMKRAISRRFPNGLLESCGLFYGFARAYMTRAPRVADAALIRYVQDQQWRALSFRSSLWR
ncbi:MAG: glycosyltransferase family A protein [Pseudomonadota bacterium]